MFIGNCIAPYALWSCVQFYQIRRARENCCGSTGYRDTLKVCEEQGTTANQGARHFTNATVLQICWEKERLRNQKEHSGRRELGQKRIVKFNWIEETKRATSGSNRATKLSLSNCLYGEKNSLAGIIQGPAHESRQSQAQIQAGQRMDWE